ncbi:hypothetical protein QYE76_006229 [Lolium multiflorum]|uniref:protein-serine/threonine phosphatase n=1 Tax=Lolium multiflorum TaxID=4521 RepID=A0AAD8RVJ7_LOLMU|nr:hypothetical protein QYE76_006229 [Lolium multiflorum]
MDCGGSSLLSGDNVPVSMLDLHSTGLTLFFGVDDVHGGANVALYSGNRFHTELLQEGLDPNNLDNAFGHLFFRMDEQLRALANPRGRFSFNLLSCLSPAACVKVWFHPS